MPLDDQVFLAQVSTIQDLAEQGPCIIVGCGANQILSACKDLLNIFIYAERSIRLKRIIEVYGIPENRAEKQLDAVDKNRAVYLKNIMLIRSLEMRKIIICVLTTANQELKMPLK